MFVGSPSSYHRPRLDVDVQVFPPRLPYRSFPERVNSVLQAFGVSHVDLTVLGSVQTPNFS